MSGRPAARIGDTVVCPKCGQNAVVTGISSVLFENMPAATETQGCGCGSTITGNVIPTVLIGGLPAATLGSTGSHGSEVTSGAASVLIGNSHTPAPFIPPEPINFGTAARTMPASPALPSLPQRPSPPVARSWQEEPDDPAPLGLEEEDEEEELEEQVQQGITLRVGFFFDGTGDNAANVARGEQCRANQHGYDAADERALLEYCPPHQLDPMSSYGRQRTNIARLYDLYRSDADRPLGRTDRKAVLRVYVEGVGTKTEQPDQQFPDMALGGGETGVIAKVESAAGGFMAQLDLFTQSSPDLAISIIEVDVFGFSRGAAAARHFVNDLRRGISSLLAKAMHNGEAPLIEGFGWRFGEDVRVNLVGLFDTVAAIGGLSDGWDVNDDQNGDLQLYLAPDSAKRVIHLVAGDEYRHNYSLNSTHPNFAEIVLPGAHGDIGGNYPLEAEEKLFLTRPFRDEVDNRLANEESQAWKQASRALDSWWQRGLIDLARPNGKLYIDWRQVRSTDDPIRRKVIYAQVKLDRRVRGEYGRIPLRIMHALAQEAGVPFELLEEFDPEAAIPRQLQTIADKLMAYAQGKAPLNLEFEEQDLLYAHFLHQAAHWNVYPGDSGALTVHFVNRPAKDGQRAIHPNKPDPVNLL
ncbi:type IV secretion protein Rhs [Pseudomonas sp. CrR25]|nr:type IV secretion protein Rhs [Pseudomonas sp. CrR25]